MHVRTATATLCLIFISQAVAAIPTEDEFVPLNQFPQPAPGAFSVVGTAVPDGRFIMWDGDNIFLQRAVADPHLDVIASGYDGTGGPGFMTLNPAGDRVLLGQGFGDGTNANLYFLDLANPDDFMIGDEFTTQSHFDGAFLSSTLVALDRGDFGFPSEVIVVDVTGAKSAPSGRSVIRRPEPKDKQQVIEKPPGSFASSIAIDPTGTLLYVMDANAAELRTFLVADVINAFNTATPLDWNVDGTLVGAPGTFSGSGVAGFTGSGNIVLGGFGGIQIGDPVTATVLDTLAPAGTAAFYSLIYNDVTEEIIALPFGLPAYGTPKGLPALPAETVFTLMILAVLILLVAWSLRRRPRHELVRGTVRLDRAQKS